MKVSNSAGHEGMETMTCYCKTDMCNDRNFRRHHFRKWQKETEALFEVLSLIDKMNSYRYILSNIPHRQEILI